MHISITRDYIPDMDANADAHLPFLGLAEIPRMERGLQINRALHRGQRARELNQETIARGLDLTTIVSGKNAAHQAAMLLEQFQRESFIALRERAVTHH